MAEFPAPFIGPTYQNTFLPSRMQRCINWYHKGGVLHPRPGYTEWVEVGTGPIRWMLRALGKLYVVSGKELYEINGNGASTLIGTLNTTVNPVSMETNGSDILIVDGADAWTYDGTTYQQVTDADFVNTITRPKFVVFSNGFYLVMNEGEARIYKSQNKYDAINWAGEFATAEYHPDDLATIITQRADVWLLGSTNSLEAWYYSGADFPWDANPNVFQDYACLAPYSATRFDNGLAWIATSEEVGRIAVRTRGYQVERISTTVIEEEWATYTNVSDAIGFSMKMPGVGHLLVFVFPTADTYGKTWVYDAEESMWHEWSHYDPDPDKRGRHRANCYAQFEDMHLIGDFENGKIYKLSNTDYTDDGTTILRDRMGPDLYHEKDRIFHHGVEVDMNTGVGLTSGQGSDPSIRLYYSDDRNTWSNFKTGAIGKIGEYLTRVIFRRLGTSRNRVYRITMSDPVPAKVINAVVHATPGRH